MYFKENDNVLNATINWKDAKIVYEMNSCMGTNIKFIRRPNWGIACYMNDTIQSCEFDEKLYHSSLVDPILKKSDSQSKNIVCIFGGGEGATAREVLKYNNTIHVDMIEWDKDVVNVFQTFCPEWAKGAWDDKRLSIHFKDAFKHILEITDNLYSHIIVDLFEPDELSHEIWNDFFKNIFRILQPGGKLSLYAGMYNYFEKGESQTKLSEILKNLGFQKIEFSKIFIPSFLGESCFIFAEKSYFLIPESDSE